MRGKETEKAPSSGYATAQLVGLAPGPTALFTLALLLLAPGRPPWLLMALPLAWCGLAGVRAWALDLPADWPLPVLALTLVLLALWRGPRAI